MIPCICGSIVGHAPGCPYGMRENDQRQERGLSPSKHAFVKMRDPIMDLGGPFNDDEIFDRPTLDPDEHK